MLDHLYGFIKSQGNNAQDDNACDHHIQLKYLGAVDDQVAKSPPGGEKFSDDHAYQRQPDVHLCGTQQNGNGAGEYYFGESVPPGAA